MVPIPVIDNHNNIEQEATTETTEPTVVTECTDVSYRSEKVLPWKYHVHVGALVKECVVPTASHRIQPAGLSEYEEKSLKEALSRKVFPTFDSLKKKIDELDLDFRKEFKGAGQYCSIWDRYIKFETEGDLKDSIALSLVLHESERCLTYFACMLCMEKKGIKNSLIGATWRVCPMSRKVIPKVGNLKNHFRVMLHQGDLVANIIKKSTTVNALTKAIAIQRGKSKTAKLKQVHASILNFQERAGLPDSVIHSPAFHEMAADIASLNEGGYEKISLHASNMLKQSKLGVFFYLVQSKLRIARDFMHARLNSVSKNQNGISRCGTFLVGSHDGYQTSRHEMFSSTLMWICPIEWKLHSVVTGLKEYSDHSSERTADIFFEQCSRTGIQQSDFIAIMSDTSNAAVKTSRLILASAGQRQRDQIASKCDMHMASLAFDHAFGKGTDRFIDSTGERDFHPGIEMAQSIKNFIGWLNDGRNKRRADEYKDFAKERRMTAKSIDNLSDTRISSLYDRMQDLIRSFYLLRDWLESTTAHRDGRSLFNRINWELITKFEALLREPISIAMYTQSSKSPSAGVATMYRMAIMFGIETVPEYRVIDIKKNRYDCSVKFEALLESDDHSSYLTLESQSLGAYMGDQSALLKERLVTYLGYYFDEPDRWELLGLLLNPITLTLCQKAIKDYSMIQSARAEQFLREEFEIECNSTLRNNHNEENTEPLEQPRRKARFNERSGMFSTVAASMREVRANMDEHHAEDDELKRWLALKIDWGEVIKRHNLGININECTWLDIAKVFDPLILFKESLAKQFPIISRLALRILAIPSSNAFIERFFSGVTYIDTDHRQRVRAETLETNALLRVNYDFISEVLKSQPQFMTLLEDDNICRRWAEAYANGSSEELASIFNRVEFNSSSCLFEIDEDSNNNS